MDRRAYLGGCACLAAALAGCAGRGSDDGGGSGGSGGDGSGETELPVPESELRRGAAKDAIPAIVDPVFGEDWSDVSYTARGPDNDTYESEGTLAPDDRVVGVARDGEARAYPLRVLNWHEIVNDTFDGPLLVTYCPLCGSAVTAVREAGGEVTTFGVSGFLYRSDLVMYDEATDSLWSQIEARAIRGELTGERLELVPSSLTTWREWREEHPDTTVLVPPPASGTVRGEVSRNYDVNPYAGYETNSQIGIGGSYDDDRLHPKTTVVGVAHDGVARAYPRDRVAEAGVVNDHVNGLPVVVATTGDTVAAYVRRVDGETVMFERAGRRHVSAAGSRWRVVDGVAVDGPHEGTTLAQANDVSPLFFFAWKNFHADTEVWSA